MINKTDLAKFENSFNQMPDFVSKGAQWNFGKFAEEISGKDDTNRGYGKKMIPSSMSFGSRIQLRRL